MTLQILASAGGKMELLKSEAGKLCLGGGFVKEEREFHLDGVSLMPLRHPGGNGRFWS